MSGDPFQPASRPRLGFARLLAVFFLASAGSLISQDEKDFSDPDTVEARAAAVREEIAALPPETDAAILEEMARIETATDAHLDATDLLDSARRKLAEARETVSAWTGFPGQPPYPVRTLDALRETKALLEGRAQTLSVQKSIYESEIEGLRSRLDGHQQAERRFLEVAEQNPGTETGAAAQKTARLENLAARAVAERIGSRLVHIATLNLGGQEIEELKSLADRQIAAIGDRVSFDRKELDEVLAEIGRERTEAVRLLGDLAQRRSSPDPLLSWKIEFLDLMKDFWEARYALFHAEDETEKAEPLSRIKETKIRIGEWIAIFDLRISGEDTFSEQLDIDLLRQGGQRLASAERLVDFVLAASAGPGRSYGKSLLDHIGTRAAAIWNAELYLAEETDIVEGKKIAVYRAVTTAKLARLFLILVVGWFLLRWISGRLHAAVVRGGRIPESTARLLKKWAFGLGLLLLLLYGLNAVSIPLTVFAFLGGALAIGLGFGTQTLLKNFISGLILLFERPLKVGDVVQAAEITGTIREIGIRASVIQHFDGVETLVPNSFLLENQLTNWTFSNTIIRGEVSLGVAYGSPTREVARILLEVAGGHGLVKKNPPPEVRFEAFGADSLVFILLFWLDTRTAARATLCSDLRYMIDNAFAEAGISIAFPQRDVHIDSSHPLRIELSRARPDSPGPHHGESPEEGSKK